MSNLDYAHIEPLIANVEERGRSVAVQFECPASGRVVKAQHTLAAKSTNTMGAHASRTVMYEVRRSMGPMIRGIFGNSAMGRMASSMADSAMRNATMPRSRQSMSSSERNKAVVESFKSVVGQFVWEAKGSRWINAQAARELMAPFELQLTEGPVETAYDRQILARMLVEIANADDNLADAERSFITDFLSPDVGSLDSLLERPPLTGAELSNTARGATRGTLLMLSWVMALSDEHFDAAEGSKLEHYAKGLGLSGSQANAMRTAGQGYLLDQALDRMFTWGGHDAHARKELYALADGMGMTREEAEQCEARFQRRRGM